ncbi:NAD-dependent epimerase/dehydratase family protein [Bradyrhizobium glycinis]|uniref:NAD-dependent epimerase/dehydratase family protein n=1 Tax=Bradyrhizobium glycinis TaxID=2751812 RepID=UPI0018D6A58D|nr:NAD-dependent epimerase/dehydratase family protein [Bradyrhizobium glycinis]MBH5371122.1 NAD(P)-dependent oxidoreductase [Bradyrhizobium glycinis]
MTKSNKRVAVTGGHGKIGKTLVPYLRERGYNVFTIDRDGPESLEEPMMVADLTDFGQALDALSMVPSVM